MARKDRGMHFARLFSISPILKENCITSSHVLLQKEKHTKVKVKWCKIGRQNYETPEETP